MFPGNGSITLFPSDVNITSHPEVSIMEIFRNGLFNSEKWNEKQQTLERNP